MQYYSLYYLIYPLQRWMKTGSSHHLLGISPLWLTVIGAQNEGATAVKTKFICKEKAPLHRNTPKSAFTKSFSPTKELVHMKNPLWVFIWKHSK